MWAMSIVVVEPDRVVVVRPKRFCALAIGVRPSMKTVRITATARATENPTATRRVGRRGLTGGERLERIIVDGRRGGSNRPAPRHRRSMVRHRFSIPQVGPSLS